jgi:flavoprotein
MSPLTDEDLKADEYYYPGQLKTVSYYWLGGLLVPQNEICTEKCCHATRVYHLDMVGMFCTGCGCRHVTPVKREPLGVSHD